MDLTTHQLDDPGCVVVAVAGEVDLHTAPALKEALALAVDDALAAAPPKALAIDLSEVGFIDSTGLGVLVGVHKRMSRADRDVLLYGLDDRQRRLFELTSLDQVFMLVDDLAAVRAHVG